MSKLAGSTNVDISWMTRQRLIRPLLGVLLSSTALVSQVGAATNAPPAEDGNVVEEVIVTGTRREVRSPTDMPSPVDIISADTFTQQGFSDVSDMMRTMVPSFFVGAHPISGTSTTVRPATLRGLSPDHTLVLVNGKRRHRGPDIPTFAGGIADGSQGPDISSIPSIALKQIEVLRDGAAAQYGSDAIAGVINFILNDAAEGGVIEGKLGSTYEGDGDTYQVSGTYGLPLGDIGFVRFSGEFQEADRTNRAVQRADAAALIAAGNIFVEDPAQQYGSPKLEDDLKTMVNLALDAGDGREFYAFGGYSKRRTESDFFYRNPTERPGVYTDTEGEGRRYLIGDMTPNDGMNCDGGIDFGGTGVVNDPILVGVPDAQARLDAVLPDPNCFSILELFPGGYTPNFGGNLKDLWGSMGLRGEMENGLRYDVSIYAGRNSINFDMEDVTAPSLGALMPTVFDDLGARSQSERNVNIDLSYPLPVAWLASPLNIAGGFEWRREKYSVRSGQPESWEAGILTDQGFAVGQEAFPGFAPNISGSWDRSNIAFYLDLETDVTKSLVLGGAVRYEDFSDFGSETTFKVSGLYKVTNAIGLRSTYATGFHAPTPGQQNFSTLTSVANEDGTLSETGIIPSTNPIAMSKGGKQLDPETSDSFSVGFVFDTERLSVTVDYYHIKMKDRLTQSATQSLTDEERDALVAAGFGGASVISSFRFFTNDFDSKTQGVDIVATAPLRVTSTGDTSVSLAVNWTKTEVTSFDPTDPDELLSAARVLQLEKNNPKWRGYIMANHAEKSWRVMARVNYFGSYTEAHVHSSALLIEAGSEITVDLEVGVRLMENVEMVVGAQNLFNNFPDRNPWDFIVGSKYPTTAPHGIDGGFYYGKLRYNF